MVDPFQGAPAFIAKVGPSTRDPGHVFPGNTPTNNPAGKACGNCHGFVLSGTVFRDAAGTIPADRVEVRARDANGAAVSAWTDQDGNFFVPRTANIALPVTVAVRDAARTTPMLAKIANGTCASASCHVPAKEGPIHLP